MNSKFQVPRLFVNKLPSNLTQAQKLGGMKNATTQFTKFVCCPTCNSLYNLENCIKKQSELPDDELLKCTYVHFPNHPQVRHRKACGTALIKKVTRKTNNSVSLTPKKIYCYKSLTSSLQEMMLRPGFIEKCEEWRSRDGKEEGTLSDVYDGSI